MGSAAELPLRRRIALLLLGGYALALVLAALPAPVRPGWLARPSQLADVALRAVGVRAGVAVFMPPRERIELVLRADCIEVRGLRSDRTPVVLEPPDGRCVREGPRLWLPSTEWMLRSILTGGEASVGELLREAAIGDYFCHGRPFARHGFDEIDLVWRQPVFHRVSRAESTRNVLYFRWRCDPPALLLEARAPSDAELRALLGDG